MKIERISSGKFLYLRTFAALILKLAGKMESKYTDPPLPLSHLLYEEKLMHTDTDIAVLGGIRYHEVLWSIVYLATHTRPDMATSVSILGKFQQAQMIEHCKSMKYVISCVIGTVGQDILFCYSQETTLQEWEDADWAGHQ